MATDADGQRDAKGGGPSISESFGLQTYTFTRGKWILLAAAAGMVVLGLILSLGASRSSTPSQGADTTGRPANELLGSSFSQSSPSTTSSSETGAEPEAGSLLSSLSPFMVKGGFGLFIGFAIGFAIRSFIRLAVVIVGFYLLTLSLMAYAGWVEIHWQVMQDQFTQSIATLGEQFTSFKAFLTGAIPASGMTAVGLTVGLKKG